MSGLSTEETYTGGFTRAHISAISGLKTEAILSTLRRHDVATEDVSSTPGGWRRFTPRYALLLSIAKAKTEAGSSLLVAIRMAKALMDAIGNEDIDSNHKGDLYAGWFWEGIWGGVRTMSGRSALMGPPKIMADMANWPLATIVNISRMAADVRAKSEALGYLSDTEWTGVTKIKKAKRKSHGQPIAPAPTAHNGTTLPPG